MKLQKTLGLWVAGFLSAGVALAEPVAMVTDVSDGVFTVVKDKSEKVALLSYFEPGTTLRLNANAHLTATFLTKPVEYRFTGPAKLTVEKDRIVASEGKAETHAVSLQKTSAAKKFTVAQRESVTQAAFEMRGAGRPGLRLDDPVDTRLTGNSLVFSWDGPRSPSGYRLSLFDEQKKLIHQTSVASNSWAPAAGLLKAGSAYEWEVESTLENGEVLTARGKFNLADSDSAKAAQAQTPPANSSFSARVLHAIYLEENGFKYDARRLWKELSKERPDDMVARERSTR
ncbi:MAG: hypothetical protein PHD65_06735 [Gallionella sp.]|nr:hypothetical protein [Gallionella sp.]